MSNINPNNIDGTFPIAGQDNSSQGFRDNFTNIRNNFSYAQSEISDLQAKTILSAPLAGQTIGSGFNNLSYNQIQNAQLFSPSYTFLNLGTPIAGSITLDYSQANFQKLITAGSYTLAFTNWPTNSLGSSMMSEIVLWVHVTTGASLGNNGHTLTLPLASPNIIGMNDIAGANINTNTIIFDTPGDYFFKFTTVDGGSNVVITDITRNAATLRDPNFYFNDNVTPTLLIGYGATPTMFQTVLGFELGQDAISAHGSVNSVSVGNIYQANISSPMFDTGSTSGFSVSALRGNLQTATLTPVNSGDFLGYMNAITYTGTGVGNPNALQQVAAIGYYANGSNAVTGLGGNVTVYTRNPASAGNVLTQVAGFENDQTTKFYGNTAVAGQFQANSGAYVPGAFVGGFTDGIVMDYVTANGRLSVGSGDGITFYNNLDTGTRNQLMSISSTGVLSVTSAIQFANLTTTQVNAISGPVRGMTVYNYTSGNIQVYNGTKWANIVLS